MVKTRSQTGNIAIKKEEEDSKPTLLLNGANNTRNSSRVEKRKPSITNNRRLPVQQVKVEQDNDNKSLLKLGWKPPKSASKPKISQAQINQLISYITNDNMAIGHASRKVNISVDSGSYYYREYNKDPEKRIPLPRYHSPKTHTQEQIGNLIKYINDGKMTITEASVKTNMTYTSAYYYYNRYLKDPNHSLPILHLYRHYTQDQKRELIAYIVRDKMSILAASKKAKMGLGAAHRFYHKYFKVQNPDVSTPSHIVTPRRFTQEQLNEAMYYITNDKMSIKDASKKANVCQVTAGKRYRQYLKNHNMRVPVTKTRKHYTQDQINGFLKYVVDDKLTIEAASKKANMCRNTAYRYYRLYLKNEKHDGSTCSRWLDLVSKYYLRI